METSPCCISVAGHQIATSFCTCHDSTAVVPCTKFCGDYCIRSEMRVKRNFHRIWIAMEKPLVKRGPASHLLCVVMMYQLMRTARHVCCYVIFSYHGYNKEELKLTYSELDMWWCDECIALIVLTIAKYMWWGHVVRNPFHKRLGCS